MKYSTVSRKSIQVPVNGVGIRKDVKRTEAQLEAGITDKQLIVDTGTEEHGTIYLDVWGNTDLKDVLTGVKETGKLGVTHRVENVLNDDDTPVFDPVTGQMQRTHNYSLSNPVKITTVDDLLATL